MALAETFCLAKISRQSQGPVPGDDEGGSGRVRNQPLLGGALVESRGSERRPF